MNRERTYRTEAIVIRRSDFGEADRLLTLYTREHGKLRRWNTGELNLVVVATGMESGRFESVADFVEITSRRLKNEEEYRIAMVEALKATTRCS